MTRRSVRLQPAANVAETRERVAARVFGDALGTVRTQEAKLVELETYRDQYSSDFHSASSIGMGAAQLQHYRSFLGRLNEAIKEQLRIIDEVRRQSEGQRQVWLKKRSKMKAIERVLEKCHEDERAALDRHDQRIDDRGGRSKRKKSTRG